ncbi:MAG: hypothetical protein EA351_02135 [Gemmatimonadales bacterium]|nr:MAG: hypothetical protein EA351_02135 [Gemmatimonadales bacterium]
MTDHVEAGEIQAWLDNELRGVEAARVQEHLETCARCRAEAEEVQKSGAEISGALRLLDTPPRRTLDEARWEVRRQWAKSRGRGSRRKSVVAAAMLVLVAGGLAAVMPGSPLRSLWSNSGVDVVPATELVAEGETDRVGVSAAFRDGRLEVELEGAPAGFGVEVRTGSGDRVQVRAHSAARFGSGAGRVTVGLEGEASNDILEIRVPPGSGEVLLRTGSRFLLRWSEGRFELAEGLVAEPLPDGVRLQVPGVSEGP